MSSLSITNAVYHPTTGVIVPFPRLCVSYKEYNGDESDVQVVHDYFTRLFPNEEVREYMLNILSDVLFKGSRNKIYIWKGNGGNGKSFLCNLMRNILGPLALGLDNQCKGWEEDTLFAYMEDIQIPIKPNTLKELVGSDPILVKKLYEDPKKMIPKFHMNILTNGGIRDKIGLWNGDEALWKHIKVIPFESTFSGPQPNVPLEAFLWLLIEQFKKTGGAYTVPERVVFETTKYHEKQLELRQLLLKN